jgi:hypothetical protein
MKTALPLGATRTQAPPLQLCAVSQGKLPVLLRPDEFTVYYLSVK